MNELKNNKTSGITSFAPTLGNYNKLETFRFWCQKVLPLVYDDSLSYYETLCKVINVLNEIIETVNDIPDYIAKLISEDSLKEILSTLLNKLEEQIASANEGKNLTATDNRSVGDLIWIDGFLYRAIRQIYSGDRYEDGSNVEKITIENLYEEIQLTFCDYIEISANNASKNITNGTWFWYMNKLSMAITDITKGTAFVNGTNYVTINIGEIIKTEINERKNAENKINNKIGELSELKTQNKSSIVNAVNELDTSVYLTPEMFGAVGDGIADDTEAIKTCINNAKENTTIFFPNTYLVTDAIEIYKPLNIVGNIAGYDTEEVTKKSPLKYYKKPTFINRGVNCLIISSICVSLTNITIVNEYTKTGSETVSLILLSFINESNTNNFRKIRFNNVYINAKNADYGIYNPGEIFDSEFNNINVIYGNIGIQIGTYSSNSTSLKFTNCYMLDQLTYAFVFRNIHYSSFISCACDNDESTGYGYNAYYFNQCSNISMVSCGCEKWNHSPVRFENSHNCLINVYTALENKSSNVLDGACFIDSCYDILFLCCESISNNIYAIVSKNSEFSCVECNYKQALINNSVYKLGNNYTSPKLYTFTSTNLTVNTVIPYSVGLNRFLYTDINITNGGATLKINDYSGNVSYFYEQGSLLTVNEDGTISNISGLATGRHILLIPIN